MAIADQREAEVTIAVGMAREQLGLDTLGALEPPGGAGDARGEQVLHDTLRGQLRQQRRLERGKLLRVLVADHAEFLGAKTMLEGVLRRARLTFGGFRAARFGAVDAARRGARGG